MKKLIAIAALSAASIVGFAGSAGASSVMSCRGYGGRWPFAQPAYCRDCHYSRGYWVPRCINK